MRNFILIFLFSLTYLFGNSQTTAENLDINNITARINAAPYLFCYSNDSSGYSFNMNSMDVNTIFTHSLWIGGKNQNLQLHLAAAKYIDGKNDYFAGPVADNYNQEYDSKYNRVWKVDMSQIQNHIDNFDKASYTMPEVIASWPAHGNTANGEAKNLAPYVDFNNNSEYDPENGDYPYINGYQAVYFIMNDDRGKPEETIGQNLGVEVHVMAFQYSNANYIIDNTVFVNYKIINRSENNYRHVYLGAFTDLDIIGADRDYIGCDSTKNMYYGYQNYNYCKRSYYNATQAVYFLNKPMTKFMYFVTGTYGNMTDPNDDDQYYNYLRARWKDGTPLTYGGTGYNDTNLYVNYAFPGNPADTSEVSWNELTENNLGADKRGLGIYGPFNFNKGQTECFSLAFAHAESISPYDGINDVKFYASHINSVYDDLNLDCSYWTSNKRLNKIDVNVLLYPNPFNDYINIDFKNNIVIDYVKVYDSQGRLINYYNDIDSNLRVKGLKKGIYLIEISDGKNLLRRKIVCVN